MIRNALFCGLYSNRSFQASQGMSVSISCQVAVPGFRSQHIDTPRFSSPSFLFQNIRNWRKTYPSIVPKTVEPMIRSFVCRCRPLEGPRVPSWCLPFPGSMGKRSNFHSKINKLFVKYRFSSPFSNEQTGRPGVPNWCPRSTEPPSPTAWPGLESDSNSVRCGRRKKEFEFPVFGRSSLLARPAPPGTNKAFRHTTPFYRHRRNRKHLSQTRSRKKGPNQPAKPADPASSSRPSADVSPSPP